MVYIQIKLLYIIKLLAYVGAERVYLFFFPWSCEKCDSNCADKGDCTKNEGEVEVVNISEDGRSAVRLTPSTAGFWVGEVHTHPCCSSCQACHQTPPGTLTKLKAIIRCA